MQLNLSGITNYTNNSAHKRILSQLPGDVGQLANLEHLIKDDTADILDDEGWKTAVARPCSTCELEGATLASCRFCTFLLQSLKDSAMLDTYRKVETRLYHLGEEATSSLSIQNWGSNPLQLLWLNLPGKVCTSCNAGMALEVKFHGSFLPETGPSSPL